MGIDIVSILVFAGIGFVFVLLMLVVSALIRPSNPTESKLIPYECGELPIGVPWIRFNMRFYTIALVFILFDVEVALMYPCAAVFKRWCMGQGGMGMAAFVEILFFVTVLFIALVYLWGRGDLSWVKKIDGVSSSKAAGEEG